MLLRLLSLLAGAAALNVTLTNTLVGTTTVRVNGAGLRVEATLGADSSLFHARYREVHIEEGRTTIKRRGPRPHHAGTASGEADGEFFTDGRATATIEQGRLKSLVLRLPGKHVEVHEEDGKYERVRAPSNDYVWAEPKTFERMNNLRRQLASNECAGGENSNTAPIKYVSVVAFNDAERYARRGTDVELRTAVWKSKFRRPTPSTRCRYPDSLVDVHTGTPRRSLTSYEASTRTRRRMDCGTVRTCAARSRLC